METGDWVFIYSRLPGEGNDGDFNFGWQGIGGTVFIVDPTNDFFLIYMAQIQNGPRGAPMDLTKAQQAVYQAMRN